MRILVANVNTTLSMTAPIAVSHLPAAPPVTEVVGITPPSAAEPLAPTPESDPLPPRRARPVDPGRRGLFVQHAFGLGLRGKQDERISRINDASGTKLHAGYGSGAEVKNELRARVA